MKKISIKTIAEKAGVSTTTVSFVLNGKGNEKNISESTQKKIIEIANTLSYKPNQIARSLIMKRSFTIGLVVPDISNPFFSKICKNIEHHANRLGYFVMFASTDENPDKERRILEILKSRQIDGVIIAPTTKNKDLYESFQLASFPAVFFDRVFENQKTNYVNINNYKSAKELTKFLIDKGNKRIGLISLTSYLPNIKARIDGYKEALKDYKIKFDSELIIEVDYNEKKEGVRSAIEKLLSNDNPVTAFIFLNNMLAAEGIWNLNKFFKEKVPEVDYACFDNLELFDYVTPKVTSVIQPAEDIAVSCVNLLCSQIDGKTNSSGITLEGNLIVR